MFSKIFGSAKDSCKPDLDLEPQTPGQQLRTESAMVTTRGRAGRAQDNSTNGQSPNQSTNRVTDLEDGTPLSRKTRKSTRLQQQTGNESDVVATPRMNKANNLPVRERDEEDTPNQTPIKGVIDIPAINSIVTSQTIETKEETEITTEGGDTPKASSKTSVVFTTPASSKHKRFGSEELEVETKIETTTVETTEVINGEDEESSDDDAPEEVPLNEAVRIAKEKAREAARAVEEQAAASRKKRQEKDALLKRQAEASSKKRKLELNSATDEMLPPTQKLKVDENVSVSPAGSQNTERNNMELDETESNTLEGDGTADGRLDSDDDVEEIARTFAPRLGHMPLPDLLPVEYLEDDNSTSVTQETHSKQLPILAKKNKLRDLIEKRPKDRRIGPTTYRVAESQNPHFPPKASVPARNLKESWLQGRPGSKMGTNRKPYAKGFFGSRN